jgi:SAM-dependent methyltransferase
MSTSGDKADLKAQYGTSSNLDARRYLHERFNTNANAWVPWLFERFDLPARSSILEIGCGTGYVWEGNRDRIPAGWLVTLTDLSPGMLAAAAQRLARLPCAFAFAVADMQALPFDDASFDCVMAHHMLYHVPDIDKGLGEVTRVLKPGGRFYASTNGQDHLAELHDAVKTVAPDMPYGQQSIIAAFCLENGSPILARHFSDVKRHDFRDALEVTEVAAVVNYVMSVVGAAQYLTPARIDHLRRIVADEIARCGAFRVRRASGVFSAVTK